MISYDPHNWNSHLLDIRGSMVRQIFARVFTCVVWATAVVATMRFIDFDSFSMAGALIDIDPDDLSFPVTVHNLIGAALGLLLVFRTNSSYDRWWEGRKLWGGIVNETRNLSRLACVHLERDTPLRNDVVRWTIAFAYASMHRLRGNASLGPTAARLAPSDVTSVMGSGHVPLQVACKITSNLRRARDLGLVSDFVMTSIDQNVQLLIDYIGACERIHRTPLPFAYVVHLRRAIILYCFTLPFALYRDFGWATIPATFFLAYVFFGIEEIGVTIEDPFEGEDNDLPLEDICQTIDTNLSGLIGDKIV